MTDWVEARRRGETKEGNRGDQPEGAEDRVGRSDRLSLVGRRKRMSMQEKDGKKR